MSTSGWSALGLAAVLACAAASAMAGDGAVGNDADGGKNGAAKTGDGAARRAAMRGHARQVAERRRAATMKFLESLQATDEQRALVLEKAKAAAPILAEARRQACALVAQASVGMNGGKADRKAVRESVKAQLRAIRDEARGRIDVLARDVVASLTPEQRQTLQDVAARHDKTIDDARLTRLAAAMISRPATVARLEARQAE